MQEGYASARAYAEGLTYATLIAQVPDGDTRVLPDPEMRRQLAQAEEDQSIENLEPRSVLSSTLPTFELIDGLERIRASIFARVSDEALYDLEKVGVLIQMLRFRPF